MPKYVSLLKSLGLSYRVYPASVLFAKDEYAIVQNGYASLCCSLRQLTLLSMNGPFSASNCDLTPDLGRNTESDAYGFATQDFALDQETSVYFPAVKKNTRGNPHVGKAMLALSGILENMDPHNSFHMFERSRQRRFAYQMAISTGLAETEAALVGIEGATLNETIIPPLRNRRGIPPSPSCHVDKYNCPLVGADFVLGVRLVD